MEERKKKEIEFYTQRVREFSAADTEAPEKTHSEEKKGGAKRYFRPKIKKFYSITRKSDDFIQQWMHDSCQGKVALDYGCGLGGASFKMARNSNLVIGIDITFELIRVVRDEARLVSNGDKTRFVVMDAEDLAFKEDSFDVIHCGGILHHLNVDRAFPEIARVMRSGGYAICHEALGYNPLFTLFRRLTPRQRTSWEADHILTMKEVKKARSYFGKVSMNFFHLVSLCAVPFWNTRMFDRILRYLEKVDSLILKVPGLQLFAWQMVFILSEPKKRM